MLSFYDVKRTITKVNPERLNLDLTELIRQKLIESDIIGLTLYGSYFQKGSNNRTDRRLMSSAWGYDRHVPCIKFGDLTKYINIQPSTDFYRIENKQVFKDAAALGYTKGTFYIVTAKYTDEFLGIIGLECEYYKAENGEKFENRYKHKTEIKGFYVTPNMTLSKKSRQIILRNIYLNKIDELLTTVQEYATYVRIIDEPTDGIFTGFHKSWCNEYRADEREVYAKLIDPKTPITELDIEPRLINLLTDQGITTINDLLGCAGELVYNNNLGDDLAIVCNSLHRYLASRYIDVLLNIEINKGVCEQ